MGRRDTLLLSILTLVTAFAWIAFDVYHATVDTTIAQSVEDQLVPITPKFDKTLVDRIKNRQKIDPLNTEGIEIQAVEVVPISTQSGLPPAQGGL